MPKVDLTDGELTEISNALDLYARSAKRAQNTGRTPQIKAVWAAHEKYLTDLMHKLAAIPPGGQVKQ